MSTTAPDAGSGYRRARTKAKARAAQRQEAGDLTKSERERIERKADKILDD